MKHFRHLTQLFALSAVATLTACGGSSGSDPTPTPVASTPTPTVTPAPTVTPTPTETPAPLIEIGENQVILYYKRDDDVYTDWGLHLFNGEGCGDFAAPTSTTDWPAPYLGDGVHPDYGAYYILNYDPMSTAGNDCLNFIIHKGDDKALGDQNSRFEINLGTEAFSFHGVAEVFYEPLLEVPLFISNRAAHWVDEATIVFQKHDDAAGAQLIHSATAGISIDQTTRMPTGGTRVDLTESSLSAAAQARFPHLSSWDAYAHGLATDEIKAALKGELVLAQFDADGQLVSATRVQTPGVIDAIYVDGDKAEAVTDLGATASPTDVQFKLWAPTATRAVVHVYDADKTALAESPITMTEDAATGIWRATGGSNLDRAFYRYELDVFHYTTNAIETVVTTDPYSLSLSTNSQYSQVVNLNDPDLAPAGWATRNVPSVGNFEDNIFYETHIRDFSSNDAQLSDPAYRGKYKAFTELDSDGIRHLTSLVNAGLNNVHLLPAFDIATINEGDDVIDINDTIADLCAVNSDAGVCSDGTSTTATIKEVLASYDPSTGDAQTLVDAFRGLDNFNWGYDPYHYNVPEGSYATDAEGVTRITEFREMVMTLNEMGLRVVMDVVYNHTNASGLNDKSVLDKVVPGYYHRYSETSGNIEKSTCCDNTATENLMMGKLMSDSLVVWAQAYGINAFRFDLMGHQPKDAMLSAREAVLAVDPENYFYGEGWNFGEAANNRLFTQASQVELKGTEIGTFNDRLRDAVRGGGDFGSGNDLRVSQGLSSGLHTMPNELQGSDTEARYLAAADRARVGLAGTLTDFRLRDSNDGVNLGSNFGGYASDPADIINYVSKHDNQTLWDNNQYRIPFDATIEQRVRLQLLALAYPMYSQGIPFFHMGSELLRSKSFSRDSFDFTDWFNAVDFSKQGNNYNVGLPPAEKDSANWTVVGDVLTGNMGNDVATASDISFASDVFAEMISIRMSSPLFRLTQGSDVLERVDFHNTGSDQDVGLIVMSIDDGAPLADLDPNNDAIVVIFNHDPAEKTFTIDGLTGLTLSSIQANGVDDAMIDADFTGSTFTVPGLSVAVFVKPEVGDMQGAGIPVDEKRLGSEEPFGDTAVYISGDMNAFGLTDEMEFVGDSSYRTVLALEADTYTFNFTDDMNGANGVAIAGDVDVMLDTAATLVADSADNISITIADAGSYRFTLRVPDGGSPTLTVTALADVPFGDSTVYVRGDMNEWGATDDMLFVGGGTYLRAIELTAGTYNFKIGDADWTDVNFGGNGAIAIDTASALSSPGGDITITVATDGLYLFSLVALDPEAPELTVSADRETYAGITMYLKGNFNGWTNDDAMTYYGDGYYYLEKAMSADTNFKIADAGWSDNATFGGETVQQIELDTALTMAVPGEDIPLTVASAATYSFLFNVITEGSAATVIANTQ